MREVDHRSSSHRSRHTSRSRSRDRDRDRDYYSRKRRSKSHSKSSKSKKKKSKKKRHRRSSSSSSTISKTSSRSRGSIKSSVSSIRRTAHPRSSEENSASKEIYLSNDVSERSTLEKIEEDSFTAKPFFSTAESKKIPEKVIIDLKNDTISVEGKVEETQPEQSQIFHPNFLGDGMRKMDKWIKKLYNYRQKAFQE